MRTSFLSLALQALLGLLLVLNLAPTQAGEVITYFHNDPAGSPVVATDSAGNVVWKESYKPYGEQIKKEAASSNNDLWFHGKAYEPATQLSYFGARYYDPVLGRFMGMDPVEVDPGNPHSFNRYAYGNNNPYKYRDPDGKFAIPVVAVPVVLIGTYWYLTLPPNERARANQALVIGVSTLVKGVQGLFNETSEEGASSGVSISDERAKHILDGDGPGEPGGGHRPGTGKPGKSEFPAGWSDEKIIDSIVDVANDPKSSRGRPQPNGNVPISGRREGVDIKVIVKPSNNSVVTGFPTNLPRNPK